MSSNFDEIMSLTRTLLIEKINKLNLGLFQSFLLKVSLNPKGDSIKIKVKKYPLKIKIKINFVSCMFTPCANLFYDTKEKLLGYPKPMKLK